MDWRVLSHIFPMSILRGVQTSVHWWSTPNFKGYSWNPEKHARTSIRNHLCFFWPPTRMNSLHVTAVSHGPSPLRRPDQPCSAQPRVIGKNCQLLGVGFCRPCLWFGNLWNPLKSAALPTGISLRHCVMNPKYQPKLAKHWLKLVRGFDGSIFFRFCIYHPMGLALLGYLP